MTVKFDYVASGTGYSGVGYLTDEHLHLFKKFYSKLQRPNHAFSTLYNAYTEPDYGPRQKSIMPEIDSVYSDSGGLQMVTKGITLSNELKDGIYKEQAQNSKYGMCFDEIPVRILGKSKIGDTQNRWVDESILADCATKTAKNIERQCEVFVENGSDCKPVIIVHGNTIENQLRWFDTVLENVSVKYHNLLDTVAISGASIGNGEYEDVVRTLSACFIPEQHRKHIHFLGVGSIKRIMPCIHLVRSGLMNNMRISYDSTTHTAGPHKGMLYSKDENLRFTRAFNDNFLKVYNEVVRVWPNEGFTLEQAHQAMCTPPSNTVKNHMLSVWLMFITAGISNFMGAVDELIADPKLLRKTPPIYRTLYDVKTIDDAKEWCNTYRHGYLKTKPLANQTGSLSEFLT